MNVETLEQVAKIATNYGLGVLSFIALMFGGYKLLGWLEKMSDTVSSIKDNHLTHISESMERMRGNTEEANKKLDAQSQMLGVIVAQTKPKE